MILSVVVGLRYVHCASAPKWIQTDLYQSEKKSDIHIHNVFLEPRVALKVSAFCSTISYFRDIPYFIIFNLLPYVKHFKVPYIF